MPVFTDMINKGRQTANKPGFVDSRDWYREKARTVMSINPNKIVSSNQDLQKSVVSLGFMYLFGYEANHKDTLPFYDRFPLIFPFSSDKDSFMGLNLHYLPHILRARLMDALYDLTSSKKYTKDTKLNITYKLLSSSAKYKYFEPCVKKYLYSHMQTRFLLVPSNEWDIALFLPLERFTVGKQKVYQDSLNKIG